MMKMRAFDILTQALFGQDGFLGGVHAADRGAVGVYLIARADALQPGDRVRWLFPSDGRTTMPSVGPERLARRSYCMACTHIGVAPVAQFFHIRSGHRPGSPAPG